MGKTSRRSDETKDQSHKRHNTKNEKLDKKKKFKKNKKKFLEERSKLRDIKKQRDELRKLHLINQAFCDKVHSDEIYNIIKVIGKLIQHDQNSQQELIGVFEMLDQGYELDLSGLKDNYVQQKLNKLLKLMHLKRSQTNPLEFKKRTSDVHDFSFVKLFEYIMKKEAERIKQEAEQVDSDDVFSSDDDGKEKTNNQQLQDLVQQIEDHGSDESDSNNQKKQAEPVGEDFLAQTMDILKKNEEMGGNAGQNEIEDELERMFSSKKKQASQQKSAPRGDNSKTQYLGVVEKKLTGTQEAAKQQAIREYMEDYDQEHRQKSLLEEFQEKKKQGKDKKSSKNHMDDFMRRPFDREKDLRKANKSGGGALGIDSKKVFNTINRNSLDKRFGNSTYYM